IQILDAVAPLLRNPARRDLPMTVESALREPSGQARKLSFAGVAGMGSPAEKSPRTSPLRPTAPAGARLQSTQTPAPVVVAGPTPQAARTHVPLVSASKLPTPKFDDLEDEGEPWHASTAAAPAPVPAAKPAPGPVALAPRPSVPMVADR